jgi:hypothetical protein
LDYLVTDGYVNASNRRIKQTYAALQNTDIHSLLNAANIMRDESFSGANFLLGWKRSLAIFTLGIPLSSGLKALKEKGATLLTTNYDDLLEKFCNLHRIGRSNQGDILKFKRGDLDGVFHVHGSYHDPDEVVLDRTGYDQIRNSEEVQNILKTFLEYYTILFVGCGSGLEDPNFDGLLKWASERQEKLPNRHCLLVRNGDTLNYSPLARLNYGADYQDLVPYLNRLLDDPSQQACIIGPTSTCSGRGQSILPFDYNEPQFFSVTMDHQLACVNVH